MPIPAIISCSLCSGVRRRAITVTCCGAGSCRSCAVKHITSSRACWVCEKQLTTKDAISDELLRKKIDELSDSSLLLCGVCAEMCKRGVSAPCCGAKACRACAVKVVTGSRACWVCQEPIEETGKLVNDDLLRAAVEQLKECGVMDPEHWDKLAVTKEIQKEGGGDEESAGQENRGGNGGGWFCEVENCHNMNLAASMECFRCGTERGGQESEDQNIPIASHTGHKASHESHTEHNKHRRKQPVVVQAEADTTNTLEEGPLKVYECPGEVVCISDFLDCGVLELKGANGKSVKCFFSGQDYLGGNEKNRLAPDHRLTQRIPHAEKNIRANARLIDKNFHLPYLASTVWPEGQEVGSEEMSKIFRPVSPEFMRKYRELSQDLSWQQSSPQYTHDRKQNPPDSYVDTQFNNQNWQQTLKASSHPIRGHTPMVTPEGRGHTPMVTPEARGHTPMVTPEARGHTPMVTPPPPILSVPQPVPAPSTPSSAPLYLKECLGVVTNLINDNYGVAAVTLPGPPDLGLSGPYLVLFDTCEFWAGSTVVSDADIPLSEVTQVGDMVKINAVQVDDDNARNIKYLATAVMTSGDLEDLIQTKFHESVAFIKDVKNVSNDKLTNFKVVVDFLNNQAIDSKEKDAVEQSTKLAEKIFASVSGSSTSSSGTVPPPLHLQYPPPTLPAPYPGPPFPLNPAMPPLLPLMAPMMPPFPFPGFPPFPSTTPRAADSGPAREKVTNLPAKMVYWNDNLICNLDSSGAYIDCVYCKETVAIKPGDNLAPYYLDHYAMESHNMMVKRITVDQQVIRNYLSERVMLQILMRKEEAAGKAVVFHKYDDIVFYRCKHWPCQDLVTSAWHFQNMVKSPKHNQTGAEPPNWKQQNEGKKGKGEILYSRWGETPQDVASKINEDVTSKEQQRAMNAAACKDTRIRLCQVGYLIKKLNDVIFDCIVCQITIFDGKFKNHAQTALHKKSEKELKNLSNQEKISLYTQKVAIAKSKATMAIVQKTAKIACKFSEDYTYDCFLCAKKSVSVFHFVKECIGSDNINNRMNANPSVNDAAAYWPPSLSRQYSETIKSSSSGFDYGRSGVSSEPVSAEKRRRSRSPRDRSSGESSDEGDGRRGWEYKKSSINKSRRSPKRFRGSSSRTSEYGSRLSPERPLHSTRRTSDDAFKEKVIKKEKSS